ncbi:MAG TPA: hypothetical protein DCP28_01745, partial [Cytophagales bacterium]|nr:hypothetical protein [Cytophagales bacterium]
AVVAISSFFVYLFLSVSQTAYQQQGTYHPSFFHLLRIIGYQSFLVKLNALSSKFDGWMYGKPKGLKWLKTFLLFPGSSHLLEPWF